MAEYTGFESNGYDRDGSDFESFEYSAPKNAHDSVFKTERTYRTVIEDDTDLIINKQMINDKMVVGNDKSNKNSKKGYFTDDSLFGGSIKKGIQYSIDGTEIIEENLSMHTYSRIANSSYEYFNSKGKIDAVHEGLQNPKYDYIDDLKGFTVDEELSTIDNLVLHDAKTGEVTVSYRGTTDNPIRTKSFLEDWRINGQIAGGKSNTIRVKQGQKQLDKVVNKYGKSELTLSGHSLGGHVSYELGTVNDIPAYSYNPAINMSQLKSAEKYSGNASKHVIFETPLDFASGLSYDTKALSKSNTSVKLVNNLVGKDNPLDTHSIDQFAPTPKEIAGGVVKVERRKIAGAVMHGVGTTVNVGLGVYDWGSVLNKDVNKNGSNVTGKIADSTIDTAIDSEEFLVDTAIADTSFALAGETFGASIVVGVGLAYVNDLAASHIAAGAKSAVRVAERQEKKAEHSIGKTFKKIGNTISNWFT